MQGIIFLITPLHSLYGKAYEKLTMVIIVALMSKKLANYTETIFRNGGHFVFQQNSFQSLS